MRTEKGLTCSASESIAREIGPGEIKLNSSVDGKLVTIVSSQQISSTCTAAFPCLLALPLVPGGNLR